MTVAEYAEFLRYGDREGCADSPIPSDFLREEDGVWFWSGGSHCVGGNGFRMWHAGTDAVYAAGSCIAANRKVPLDVLRDALEIFEQRQISDDYRCTQLDCVEQGTVLGPKTRVHLDYMADLCRAALAAKPSKRRQNIDGEFVEE